MSEPKTDFDWTIHSLNIHGTFFERWCQDVIRHTPSVRLISTNYPVEFPPPNGSLRGKESSLDIRAELVAGQITLTFLIECKKNNPELIDWIFFPNSNATVSRKFSANRVQNSLREGSKKNWNTECSISSSETRLTISDEARETRGDYYTKFSKARQKTKTSNAAISDAAKQVAIATKCLVTDEIKNLKALSNTDVSRTLDTTIQYFIPIIVTTARLKVCEFDPKDIDPSDGTLPIEKASLEEHPYLIYEYPLPRSLQSDPLNLVEVLSQNALQLFSRMHIIVVNSSSFNGFLADEEFYEKIGLLRNQSDLDH